MHTYRVVEHAPLHVHDQVSGPESYVVSFLLGALLLLYFTAATKNRSSSSRWTLWRTASFSIGIILLGIALSPAVMAYAHSDLRGHMVQHLLLGMFAPLALVLGAPGTLLLRSIQTEVARRLVALLDTRPVRFLIHPITALILDMGGMCLLYLSPLYVISTTSPTIHFLVHLHFVLSGYLYTWSIAGPDPAPNRPSLVLRLGVLFIGTAVHATLSKLMYAYSFPRGTGRDLVEIEESAKLMYYGGDLAEILLAIAFFAIWFRTERRRSVSPLAKTAA